MIKSFLFFCAVAFSAQLFAQHVVSNRMFGFRFTTPDSWVLYGSTELESEKDECYYQFFLPKANGEESLSEWDNSFGFKAKANGWIYGTADLIHSEVDRLRSKLDDFHLLQKTETVLVARAMINGVLHDLYIMAEWRNGIGYIGSFSCPAGSESHSAAEMLFRSIDYSTPEPDYADLDVLISETPEDATLHYRKAQRAFGFHDHVRALEECNTALDLFPMLGEGFYLRGYLHLTVGDTVAACRDFHAAVAEYYGGELELEAYCNTRRIAEAQREDELSPFAHFNPDADHLAYVDSVRNHPYVILSFNEKSPDELLQRMEQVQHLFMLDFSQLDSIFRAESGVLKVYAFGILCSKFPERIESEHKQLLKAKNTIPVFASSSGEHSMEVREIAKLMYSVIEGQAEDEQSRVKVERLIGAFIRSNALYPDSYIPLSFEEYHVMKTVYGSSGKTEKDSETYVIGHRYRIMDKAGTETECYHTFKLDYRFSIMIIEGEESNTFAAWPPRIEEWLAAYGKPLTEKERKKLGL